jgi:predicted nucleic acid-binding protein
MAIERAFWDTSAIIPLCCLQEMSPRARKARREFAQSYIWWGTVVEFYSGIARLVRVGELLQGHVRGAFMKWDTFRSLSRIVTPSETVLGIAAGLPAKYGVKAMDAFQLAAALEWCREKPRNRPFICADDRLGRAASEAGFDVVSLV